MESRERKGREALQTRGWTSRPNLIPSDYARSRSKRISYRAKRLSSIRREFLYGTSERIGRARSANSFNMEESEILEGTKRSRVRSEVDLWRARRDTALSRAPNDADDAVADLEMARDEIARIHGRVPVYLLAP